MRKIAALMFCMAAAAAGPSQEKIDTQIAFQEQGEVAFDPELSAIELSVEPAPLKNERLKVRPKELARRGVVVRDMHDEIAALAREEKEVAEELARSSAILIDLREVFAGSPTIYSILFALSIASLGIWIYLFLGLKEMSHAPMGEVKGAIDAGNYDGALQLCEKSPSLLLGMVGAALKSRSQGMSSMREVMQAEGRRLSASFWQKIGILNEIAVVAPMLGLLGTVLGMFYAFYDLNRSVESISALFDGLGISVGTTVGGLIVAILALLLHAGGKYLLMRKLTHVEQEAEKVVLTIRGSV